MAGAHRSDPHPGSGKFNREAFGDRHHRVFGGGIGGGIGQSLERGS